MKAWLQPLMDASKPAGFNSLDVTKFTLGSTAIKFAGIRYQHTDENLVRLDLEIKWAGNPEITIEVGRKSFPLSLEITNLRFSAILRIELTPLVPGKTEETCLLRVLWRHMNIVCVCWCCCGSCFVV